MPLPEAIAFAKRARGNNDEQEVAESITLSSGLFGDRASMAEHEHPNSAPEYEAFRPASPADRLIFQASPQSSKACNAVQIARMALLADGNQTDIVESRQSDPSQDNTPSNSKVVQPSIPHVPASCEQNRQPLAISSAPPESQQYQSKFWNAPRANNTLQSPSPAERDHHTPHDQSASVGYISPPGGTYRSKSFSNDESSMLSGASDQTLMQEIEAGSQRVGSADTARGNDSSMLSGSSDQILMQDVEGGSQRVSSADIARSNRLSGRLNAGHYPQSVDDPAGSGTRLTSFPTRFSLQPQRSTYQPPAVMFTIDNRIQSALHTAKIESLFEIFSRNCRVVIPKKAPMPDTVHHIDVIIWQHPPDFYKWYTAETRTATVSTLKFELFDAKGRLEKAIYIPVGDVYFQMLKQCIWDSFWVAASKFNSTQGAFKVLIRPTPHQENVMNTITPGLVAGRCLTSGLTTVGTDGQPPVTLIPQLHNSYQAYHEDPTGQQISLAPRTACIQRNRPNGPESFADYGTSASNDVARYIPEQYQQADAPQFRDSGRKQTAPAPDIVIRLQVDGTGSLSVPYEKSALRTKITTTEFFAWFANQTGHGGPRGPPSLRFTFKDAMPLPTSSTIAQANEDHFNLLRKDIMAQFEKARKYVPYLKEFAIVVTDPGWVSKVDDW